jgi:hypothetical protein
LDLWLGNWLQKGSGLSPETLTFLKGS